MQICKDVKSCTLLRFKSPVSSLWFIGGAEVAEPSSKSLEALIFASSIHKSHASINTFGLKSEWSGKMAARWPPTRRRWCLASGDR